MSDPSFFDAFSPPQVAARMRTVGVAKATMPALQIITLALIAGAFIAFGAMYYTVVMTEVEAAYGPARLLGGIAFSLGFILVIIAGAELFTGNNLIIMAWAGKQVSTTALLRNWGLVYFANALGAFASVLFVYYSGYLEAGNHAVGATAVQSAVAKVDHGFVEAFTRGLLCNALVCLASWMCSAARSVTDKILSVLFPISGFVAMGFEHCVANMYMIPIGIVAAQDPAILEAAGYTAADLQNLDAAGFFNNLVPVTLGNIVGGAGFVALVYYFIYLRGKGEGMNGV